MSPRRRPEHPRKTLAAGLADTLRASILSGELTAGDPLREEELAIAHSASRHTVRTALAALVAEGLAESAAYHGVRVRTFQAADVRALQQLRTALEAEAVTLLHERWGRAWPTALIRGLDRAAERFAVSCTAATGGWPDVEAAHGELHLRIVAAAESPRLHEAYRQVGLESQLMLRAIRPHYSLSALAEEHSVYIRDIRQHGAAAVRAHHAHSTRLMLGDEEPAASHADRNDLGLRRTSHTTPHTPEEPS